MYNSNDFLKCLIDGYSEGGTNTTVVPVFNNIRTYIGDKINIINYNGKSNEGEYDSRNTLILLEIVRGLLVQAKQDTFSSEIVNAIYDVESAIMNYEHFLNRRKRLDINHLPIPEDMSETLNTLSKTSFTKITFNVYYDSTNKASIITTETFEGNYVTAVISPIIYGFLSSANSKELKYFIESIDGEHITIGYSAVHDGLFNVEYPSVFSFRMLNFRPKNYSYIVNNIVNYPKYEGDGVRLVNLYQFKDTFMVFPGNTLDKVMEGIDSEISIDEYKKYINNYKANVEVIIPLPNSLNETTNRLYFTHQSMIDIAHELNKEYNIFVFSNPHHKNTLFYFSLSGDIDYYAHKDKIELYTNVLFQAEHQNNLTNALVQSVNKVFETNLSRNFVNKP